MVYPIAKRIITPIYKLWLRKVTGLENIPTDKPFIIAANHSSYYETLLIPSIIVSKTNKRMHAFVHSFYWKNFVARLFLDLWQCIPVYVEKEKDSKAKNKIALEKALDYLKKGHIMMIFPEGGRSSYGKLQKAYTGTARLAISTKVPVLPVGVIDSHKVVPKDKLLPRFARCEVKLGKLMHFDKYYNKKPTDKILKEVTRNIMKEIAKLINQKYNY